MARPFIPVSATLKVEVRYSCLGQRIENVLYYSRAAAWTVEDAQMLGDGIVNWFSTNMVQLMPESLSFNSIRMTNMETATAFAFDYVVGLPIAGENTQPAMPLNVTIAIKLGTASRGRSYTGRSYWPVLTREFVVGNQVTVTGRDYIQAAWEALRLLSPAGTFGASLSVVSFTTNKVLRTQGITTPVTSVSVDENIDSQRRRLTGRGQ